MHFCSFKNALLYSLTKCSYSKCTLKKAFCQGIQSIFERAKRHFHQIDKSSSPPHYHHPPSSPPYPPPSPPNSEGLEDLQAPLLSYRDLQDNHWDVCIQVWPPPPPRFQNNDMFEIIHKLQNCDLYYRILIFRYLSSGKKKLI